MYNPGSYYIGNFTIVQYFNKREPVIIHCRKTWSGVLMNAREMQESAGGKIKIYENGIVVYER